MFNFSSNNLAYLNKSLDLDRAVPHQKENVLDADAVGASGHRDLRTLSHYLRHLRICKNLERFTVKIYKD